MQFFIDTANLSEIRAAMDMGLVDGVTTNPTLMSKEAADWREIAGEICKLVPGPVSLEVIALDAEGMVREAKDLVQYGPNVVVKVPMTAEGLKAVRILKSMDIETNVTLIFSANQALLAAKAGAAYVSPFLGRLDDVGQDGMELVHQILGIYSNYGFATKIIVASVRSPLHVLDAAMAGAHIATVPYKILTQLMAHPLTDKGIEAFLKDWEKKVGK
ncbi:MAG: fructose-6-phosphate aldolase [Desulfomicrobium sp.]|nr:fructose-6-phosphate aldolase [Pseudomonadota bacterium]MBV1713383.1 fructose-6-phosphate aldolase [Desulfomicrobium sp.]MBU4570483.1 fructose-6-phosphate aldolase [Pseudomonadota bacterium]MBU4593840.1 fructose-6-phosphate aldolase [Pseudomonadota bacterium]MBV1719706.1 fructose-6-phosphate aldolase [Desulfomicrobium sp.]